jgi:formamidopyrimidine-DNA glycosylase
VVGKRIREVIVRNPRLRWPVPRDLATRLRDVQVLAIRRRGKYLLFDCEQGHLLVHLGMSGRLTLVPVDRPAQIHDHVDLRLEGNRVLRLTDPRRFGAMLWIKGPAERHALLASLGLEPLEPEFTGEALFARARGRNVAVKQFLMNGNIVTGVGNIYASEALFHAGIHPARAAGKVSAARWDRLASSVRDTLDRALRAGGTTLRDYASADGQAGGFQFEVAVYDRAGQPCRSCGTLIKTMRQGARATYYCPACQR